LLILFQRVTPDGNQTMLVPAPGSSLQCSFNRRGPGRRRDRSVQASNLHLAPAQVLGMSQTHVCDALPPLPRSAALAVRCNQCWSGVT